MTHGRRWQVGLLAGMLLFATTACGGDDGGDASPEAPTNFEDLVAAAKDEGSVTIYSSQNLDGLDAFAAAFEEQYPEIEVEVVRGLDSELATKVETENQTGRAIADFYVSTDLQWVTDHADQGWFTEPVGPHLTGEEGDYDSAQYMHDGNQFEVGAALLTLAWNTELVSRDLTGYEDLLGPEFADESIGIIDLATSSSIVDFYLWLEETFGEDYVEQLAAQKPRIYASALTINEGIASGEIKAGVFVFPDTVIVNRENGAPVDFVLDDAGAWGSRYYGMILEKAANPSAAQLLADFMVTPEGQELVNASGSAVLADVPGTLLTNEDVRQKDLEKLTPEAVAEYTESWKELFQ